MSPVTAATVASALEQVRNDIADAGGSTDVEILAVTKGHDASVAAAALEAGQVRLGESYAQEFVAKLARHELAAIGSALPTPEWHFIGRLQSNKVRQLAAHVSVWQSLDRASVIDAVATRAPGATVLIQVNATAAEHKGGAAPADVADLVSRARDKGLLVDGLMTVGVQGDDRATETAFTTVGRLADTMDLRQRSMGMSEDLAIAVRCGSTMVRVGTGLFGRRPSALD